MKRLALRVSAIRLFPISVRMDQLFGPRWRLRSVLTCRSSPFHLCLGLRGEVTTVDHASGAVGRLMCGWQPSAAELL